MSFSFADSSQAVDKIVWHTPLLCLQWKTPDDGLRNCPKHVEFYSKNKFEKLVLLANVKIFSSVCVCVCVDDRIQSQDVKRSWWQFANIYPCNAMTLSLLFLYGCQTLSFIVGEELMLRVLENMVLWCVFGPKTDEVTREWRRLHIEQHYDLYCSPNFIRLIKFTRIRWTGRVAIMGEKRGA